MKAEKVLFSFLVTVKLIFLDRHSYRGLKESRSILVFDWKNITKKNIDSSITYSATEVLHFNQLASFLSFLLLRVTGNTLLLFSPDTLRCSMWLFCRSRTHDFSSIKINTYRSWWFRCRSLRRLHPRHASIASDRRATRYLSTTTTQERETSLPGASVENERTYSCQERVHPKSGTGCSHFQVTCCQSNTSSSTTASLTTVASSSDQWIGGRCSETRTARREVGSICPSSQSNDRRVFPSSRTGERQHEQIQSSETIVGLDRNLFPFISSS